MFLSPARPATRANPSPRLYGLFGGVLGAMIGAAVAYVSAARRRRVEAPEEPEPLLLAPFLGAIPSFDDEIDTQLPVANAPESMAAEAFRFLMAAVESQLSRVANASHLEVGRSIGDRTVFVTSTTLEDGRSTVAANMAIAAAKSGKRVLVLDADFGTQGVTQLLLPETEAGIGITEVVVGMGALEQAINKVHIGTDLKLFRSSERAERHLGVRFSSGHPDAPPPVATSRTSP